MRHSRAARLAIWLEFAVIGAITACSLINGLLSIFAQIARL
jgi:hypothetical protein